MLLQLTTKQNEKKKGKKNENRNECKGIAY